MRPGAAPAPANAKAAPAITARMAKQHRGGDNSSGFSDICANPAHSDLNGTRAYHAGAGPPASSTAIRASTPQSNTGGLWIPANKRRGVVRIELKPQRRLPCTYDRDRRPSPSRIRSGITDGDSGCVPRSPVPGSALCNPGSLQEMPEPRANVITEVSNHLILTLTLTQIWRYGHQCGHRDWARIAMILTLTLTL